LKKGKKEKKPFLSPRPREVKRGGKILGNRCILTHPFGLEEKEKKPAAPRISGKRREEGKNGGEEGGENPSGGGEKGEGERITLFVNGIGRGGRRILREEKKRRKKVSTYINGEKKKGRSDL